MGAAPRVGAIGRVLLAGDLLAGRRVPKPELRRGVTAVARDAAGQNELRIHGLPGIDIWADVGIGNGFRKTRRIERLKENGMGEIVGDDRADLGFRAVAGERRHRDRHRREVLPGMHVDVVPGARGRARERCADRQNKQQPAGEGREQRH